MREIERMDFSPNRSISSSLPKRAVGNAWARLRIVVDLILICMLAGGARRSLVLGVAGRVRDDGLDVAKCLRLTEFIRRNSCSDGNINERHDRQGGDRIPVFKVAENRGRRQFVR